MTLPSVVYICAFIAVLMPLTGAFAQSSSGLVPTQANTGFLSLTTSPGGYTLMDTDLGIEIFGIDQGRDGINAACKFAPKPPYSIIAHFHLSTVVTANNDSGGGLAWHDDSYSVNGAFITEYFLLYPGSQMSTGAAMYSIDFAGPTPSGSGASEGSALYSINNNSPQGWQKLVDNGSQIQVFYSYDGLSWSPLFSPIVYASTYFSKRPPEVCLFASGHMSPISMIFDYYRETSP